MLSPRDAFHLLPCTAVRILGGEGNGRGVTIDDGHATLDGDGQRVVCTVASAMSIRPSCRRVGRGSMQREARS